MKFHHHYHRHQLHHLVIQKVKSLLEIKVIIFAIVRNYYPFTSIFNQVAVKQFSRSRLPGTKHLLEYLSSWEKTEAQHKTYVYNNFGRTHELSTCWLYFEDNSMHCTLYKKYNKRKNANGTF